MAGSETRQRTKQVKIRFTPEEFNAIAAKLETGTLSMSAYGRMTMLGEPGPRARRRLPADHQALRQMLGHLGRVGNNLNQIARHLNTGADPHGLVPELQDALADYARMRDALYAALGKEPDAAKAATIPAPVIPPAASPTPPTGRFLKVPVLKGQGKDRGFKP